VVGMSFCTVGVFLLSRMDPSTDPLFTSVAMAVMGLGVGMVMQVLVLAIQNAVEQRDMGAGTSVANFFRSIGGTFGTAVLGAVFAARLGAELAASLPSSLTGRLDPASLAETPAVIARLEPAVREAVVGGIASALDTVFVAAIPLAAAGFVLALLLPEIPLRDTAYIGAERPAEPLAEDGRRARASRSRV
jgi:hypothetical protein